MLPIQLISAVLLGAATVTLAQVEPLSALNTPGDERAVGVRLDSAGTELWVTAQTSGSERMLKVYRLSNGQILPLAPPPEPINVPSQPWRSARTGCAAFPLCTPTYGVFVSNRVVAGKDFDNDLYHMRYRDNRWIIARLDSVCSEWWDDTPSLSPDGRLLFFASDREGHQYGRTDLFVSRWLDSTWSRPSKLAISTERWNEQSPYAAADGYLYFSTDRSGDFDIWRVSYDPSTGQTVGSPEPVPFPGVNQRGTHEGSPAFAERGTLFLFSSNRTQRGDYDIFAYRRAPQGSDSLTILVVVRSRVVDWLTGAVEDSISVYRDRPVQVRDLLSGELRTATTNSDGLVRFPLPMRPLERWEVVAHVHSPRYVSSRDTLVLSSLCKDPPVHTLVVWDTAALVSPRCVQDFPVKNVRFFVTGYWCPTTLRYAPWLPCSPILLLDTCTVITYEQPVLVCQENEIFRYRLVFIPPRVELLRREGSACIDMAEARSKGTLFAQDVDAALERIINSMTSALQAPCVQRAVAEGKRVTITVTGWTDPRPLDASCMYTGPTIPTRYGVVRLDTRDSPYISGDSLAGGGRIAFIRSKAGGNYLLSQLRAYYAAILLDRLWEEFVPTYASLKAREQIEVVAVGKAVSQENRDFSERRSIEVRVEVPMPEQRVIAGAIPVPGSTVVLCQPQCAEH
ncbi:MAG: hypothetical protein D6747_00990 [Chlorobiota bacterium]|nr:MAG: hypothetical protein D6747_00990 [Chlorobiota bacterium]